MMAVSYDTAFVVHHFHYLLNIFFGGYRKDTMSYILFVDKVDKWFGGRGLVYDFVCDFLLIFLEHKD